MVLHKGQNIPKLIRKDMMMKRHQLSGYLKHTNHGSIRSPGHFRPGVSHKDKHT